MKLKLWFSGMILAAVIAGANSQASAQTVATGANCEKALRTATVLYYPASMKSMAVDLYNAHLRQGDCAKLWYDASRKEWALAIKAVLSSRGGSRRGSVASTTTTTTKTTTKPATKRTTTVTKTTRAPRLPRGANVVYFPDYSTANGIYRAALRQGDWAKMWNAGSRGWAVAIKIR